MSDEIILHFTESDVPADYSIDSDGGVLSISIIGNGDSAFRLDMSLNDFAVQRLIARIEFARTMDVLRCMEEAVELGDE